MGGRLRVKVVGWLVGFVWPGLVLCRDGGAKLVVEGAGLCCECDMPSVPGEMCFGRMDGGGIKGGREGRKELCKEKKKNENLLSFFKFQSSTLSVSTW